MIVASDSINIKSAFMQVRPVMAWRVLGMNRRFVSMNLTKISIASKSLFVAFSSGGALLRTIVSSLLKRTGRPEACLLAKALSSGELQFSGRGRFGVWPSGCSDMMTRVVNGMEAAWLLAVRPNNRFYKSMSTKDKLKLYLHKTEADSEAPIARSYDDAFRPTEAYRASMPDVMDSVESMQGAAVPIQQVGVSNFRMPLKYRRSDGEIITLETSVTGTVSLVANLKGINMSRIMRSFYELKEEVFTPDTIKLALDAFREKVESLDARVALKFNYPILQKSLRSGLEGYQYYQSSYEGRLTEAGVFEKFIVFDFVYSSACPCSAELAEHARDLRDAYSIPHSQRSKARVWVKLAEGASLSIEDLQQHCANALRTETQVMVKREDEQAFAELNGVYIKFVEDAARSIFKELNDDERISDFQVACSHLESLHSHDAVSVICKGLPGGFRADFTDFNDLIC